MSEDKILQILGLAMRAGKLVTGEEMVLNSIRSGKSFLVIMAKDASQNTSKKFHDKCKSYQVELVQMFDRYQLGNAIGKGERVIIGIQDLGFTRKIRELIVKNLEVSE